VALLAEAVIALQRGETPRTDLSRAGHERHDALTIGDPTIGHPTIGDLPQPAPSREARLLLTGATGFFGAFVLDELLRRTHAQIHCLVRAPSERAARERLRANLERYRLDPPRFSDRVTVIVGDLAKPQLGLDAGEWDDLARRLDTIYHTGAQVDLLQPYGRLEAANVGGTWELVRLATTTWLKVVHFVSTVSAATPDAATPEAAGAGPLERAPAPPTVSGYASSKRRAERLVVSARAQGVPASVYRLPRLSGDSRTGIGNPRDLALQVLTRMLEYGTAPDLDLTEEWIPVDATARLLVETARTRPDGGLFVLAATGNVTLHHVLAAARERGHDITVRPAREWARDLGRTGPQGEVLRSLLGPELGIRTALTTAAEGFTPITAPGVDRQTMGRYLDAIADVIAAQVPTP
jgi:thioester reductase-like protein